MQPHVIVDCATGKVTLRPVTAEEITERLERVAADEARERDEHLKQLKESIVQSSIELEQRKALVEEGIFTGKDLADCEARLEEAKVELAAWKKPAAK